MKLSRGHGLQHGSPIMRVFPPYGRHRPLINAAGRPDFEDRAEGAKARPLLPMTSTL